jgi:hypothetical protein
MGTMLGAGTSFDGCTLEGASIPADHVHAVFRCAGNRRVAIELRHPSTTTTTLTRTRSFALSAGEPAPSALLVEQLAASIRAHETGFVWNRRGAARSTPGMQMSPRRARLRVGWIALAIATALTALLVSRRRRKRDAPGA